MNKKCLLAVMLCILACTFAFGQEIYTIYFGGNGAQGFATIQKDQNGIITINSEKMGLRPTIPLSIFIGNDLCPLLPKDSYWEPGIPGPDKVVIDGNTTIWYRSNGFWRKRVIEGNTTMYTDSDGKWAKTVVTGNTTTTTESDGRWEKVVVSGGTTTTTSSDGTWEKVVVNGNTTIITRSSGWWQKNVYEKQGRDIFITCDCKGNWY